MTEENFFDMFNRVHNPDYYYGRNKDEKKKPKEKRIASLKETISRIQSIGLSGSILPLIRVGQRA